MPHQSACLFFTGLYSSFHASWIHTQLELITSSPNGPYLHSLGSPTHATVMMADISHCIYIYNYDLNKNKLRKCPITVQKLHISLPAYSSLAFPSYLDTSCTDKQLELVYNVPRWPPSSSTGPPQHKRPWLWPTSVTDSTLISTLKTRPSYESAPFRYKYAASISIPILHCCNFSLTSCIGSQLEFITNSPNEPCRYLLSNLSRCDRDYGHDQSLTLYW